MDVGLTRRSLLVLTVATACCGRSRVRAQQPDVASAVYELLVNGPVMDDELPPGFVGPRVIPTPAEEMLDGEVGGVNVEVQIPDLADVAISSHRIAYRIFSTPEGAERGVESARIRTERLGGEVAAMAGFDRPAAILRTSGSMFGGAAAGAVCLVNTGIVIVAGVSVLESAAKSQADLNAADLAQAGVSHLDRLVAEAADAAAPP